MPNMLLTLKADRALARAHAYVLTPRWRLHRYCDAKVLVLLCGATIEDSLGGDLEYLEKDTSY